MTSPRHQKRRYPEFKASGDLIQLAEIAKRKQAEQLDNLVTQEMCLSPARIHSDGRKGVGKYICILIKKFTRNRGHK